MIKKSFKIGMILIIWVLLVMPFISSSYIRSNPMYTSPGLSSVRYLEGEGIYLQPILDKDKCGMGQDFIIQVAPGGCQPAVVRSDLLEEQNVPVFCPLMATKLNPLIDVEAINYISFSKGDYSQEVSGVGFHPAKSAIKNTYKTLLNSPVLENIGYVVIVLKKQPDESKMPESVSGTLTANIRYDIKNAFGIGSAGYYLPELTDSEWNQKYKQYSFWKGRGYVRVENIDNDEATISIYRDVDTKVSTKPLNIGETSDMIYMPGYYCLAGMQLKLQDVEAPATRAKLKIDGDIVEVAKGEEFLDNKCKVIDLENKGLVQRVKISCRKDDGGIDKFWLDIRPKIELDISGDKDEYEVGEKLWSDSDGKDVYLGAAYTKDNTGDLNDLKLYFIKSPEHKDKLDEEEINDVYKFSKRFEYSETTGIFAADVLINVIKGYAGVGARIYNLLIKGENFASVQYGFSENMWGKQVSIIGFAEPADAVISSDFKKYFDKAKADYRKIDEQFSGERIEDLSDKTYAEQSLLELIELASKTDQKKTMIELCDEFKQEYPDSVGNLGDYCDNDLKNSNSEIDSRDVFVDGNLKTISFDGIYEPSFEEYGAEVSVSNAGEDYDRSGIQLTKNERVYLSDDGEYFELKDIGEDYIEIFAEVKESVVKQLTVKDKTHKINLNDYISLGKNNYRISVSRVNLEKVAKVKIIPNIHYAKTEANFSFNIGIEKRAIQLSPEKIESKIGELDEQIGQWENYHNKLDKTVKGLKKLCLGYGAYLTVKNFISNAKGKAIARQMVMRSDSGWYDVCRDMVERGDEGYTSIEQCLVGEADSIDKDVDRLTDIIENQNKEIKKLQETKGGILGGKIVDTEKFVEDYLPEVVDDLPSEFGDFDMDEIKELLTPENWGNGNFYKEDLRDIQLYSLILASSEASNKLKAIARGELSSVLNEVQKNSKGYVEKESFADRCGVDKEHTTISSSKKLKKISITNYLTFGKISSYYSVSGLSINDTDYVHFYKEGSESGKEYLIVFDADGVVKNTYIIGENNGLVVYRDDNDEIDKNPFDLTFEKYDKSSYENEFIEPKVRYYETEPYKGFPAIVPFDIQNGWYAAVRQTLSVFGNVKAYDESGRVVSFYLCNVGKNGKEQFNSGIGDDECRNFVEGNVYGEFPGLTQEKTDSLVRDATRAIQQAQNGYERGVRKVKILGESIEVGNPMTDVPEMQCEDFMSPKDCHLLFNVCDPVICPSSRCNLGGTYYVEDVVRSGIIGGIMLCLPNFREGIIVPVCLSGINAGMEGLISMLNSYRDCLQESLDTGSKVGICDEIHSIYLCEFMWRQITPVANIAIPKIIELAAGQGARGGGEYLSVMSAWESAQSSIDYFVNYYGANSYKAFKARSIEEVGSPICKNFISARYPASGDFLDALVEPDSPSQFHAWFDEIPFTTATVPPISQYKVFYHIYSGKDMGAYFKVYLKSSPGSSLYQDNPTVLVSSGYIGVGEYASETKDFTASSGYQQLCIVVNAQEECGFKQVSTSFAADYVKDKYVEEQASRRDIQTENECVSGSQLSLYGMANPNLQEGFDETLNPQIYNRGIVRVCATDNPAKATDAKVGTNESRWIPVGYCGERSIICWLDTQSVEDVIDIGSIKDNALQGITEDYLETFLQDENYLSSGEYKENIEEFEEVIGRELGGGELDVTKLDNAILKITSIYEKVFFSTQKVQLLSLRARAYKNIAWIMKVREIASRPAPVEDEEEEEEEEEDENGEEREEIDEISIEELSKRIIDSAKKLEGKIIQGSCWDAVCEIYGDANMDWKCIYSSENEINPSKEHPSCGVCGGCKIDPYNNLIQGYILQIFNNNQVSEGGEHNVVFEKWENRGEKLAWIYDQDSNTKKIRRRVIDFDDNPITVIWEPKQV